MRLPLCVTRRVEALALLCGLVLIATGAAAQTPAKTPAPAPAKEAPMTPAASQVISKRWTGDYDGMVQRRAIRALVPYSKTFYFVDRAVQRGLSYDVTRLLEADINKKLKTGNVVYPYEKAK